MNIPRYDEWQETAMAIHMVTQMMGKTKLAHMEPQPEWNHIVLQVTSEGFSTGLIPNGEKSFSIAMHLREGRVAVTGMDGRSSGFVLENGMSVSEYYDRYNKMLEDVMCETEIYSVPQEVPLTTPFEQSDDKLRYDSGQAMNFYRMCVFAHNAILDFVSPFRGKKILPSFFWGTFDVTGILFSGKSNPWNGNGVIERVAFDEQMIAFGFWPGDANAPDPAFFILPYPFLEQDLSSAPIRPEKAWFGKEKAEFFLKLEDVASDKDPQGALRGFFTSGYGIVAEAEGWQNLDWFGKPLLTERGSEALRKRQG